MTSVSETPRKRGVRRSRREDEAPQLPAQWQRGLRESLLIAGVALAAYLLIALASYDPLDPAWSRADTARETVRNAGGVVGAWFADVSLYLLGLTAYSLPLLTLWAAWGLYRPGDGGYHRAFRILGILLTLAAGAALAALHWPWGPNALPWGPGGLLGERLAHLATQGFNTVGATLFLTVATLIGISLATRLSWLRLLQHSARLSGRLVRGLWNGLRRRRAAAAADAAKAANRPPRGKKRAPEARPPRVEPVIVPRVTEKADPKALRKLPARKARQGDFPLPSLSLLDPPEAHDAAVDQAALERMSRLVEAKLKDFNISAQVVAVYPGPVITRYEIEPAPGTKASQITNLSRDLARSLSVTSVRVVEVIPGKTTIGLEIPNEQREIVRLVEVLQSRAYVQARSPLTLALGKDISGQPVVADLAKMPHLLVAGTTGSGKSVAINAMILSLLYNATPEEVRLIMIDPKMLELSVYDGIPHLLAPVVTDMKDAATALRWCVAEMERRYKLMAAMGVRNLAGFNKKVKEARAKGEPLRDPFHEGALEDQPAPELEPMPTIVVVVDELADLMMIVGKKV